MSPQREPWEVIPAARAGPERERVAWQRAAERTQWERLQRWRGKELGELERRSKRSWSELYGRQERQREQLAKDCHGVLGRFRAWRELGGKLREIVGTIRGRTEVLGRFQRWTPSVGPLGGISKVDSAVLVAASKGNSERGRA